MQGGDGRHVPSHEHALRSVGKLLREDGACDRVAGGRRAEPCSLARSDAWRHCGVYCAPTLSSRCCSITVPRCSRIPQPENILVVDENTVKLGGFSNACKRVGAAAEEALVIGNAAFQGKYHASGSN